MIEEIKARVKSLQSLMKAKGVDAYIVPSSDQHLSEYTPDCWKHREWITGFNGSAGAAMITASWAGLWTDSRYFLQGAEQLAGTGIELMKEGEPETPTMIQYIRKHKEIKTVGFFAPSISTVEALGYEEALSKIGVKLSTADDLIAEIMEVKQPIPMHPFFIQPIAYAGKTVSEKIEEVRAKLADVGATVQIVTMLDEVAWLFNIRNNDVAYNPVGIAYALITKEEVAIYTFDAKLPQDVTQHLTQNGVVIKPYDAIYGDVSTLPNNEVVLVDKARTTFALYQAIPSEVTKLYDLSPITLLKAIKNEAEYLGYQSVMKRDGVALTRFFIWLEKSLAKGERPTEYEIGLELAKFRAADAQYVSDSFGTIAGYQGHGAIVHYSATPESSYTIEPKGILLLDSGGQYHDGTTDITRTISLDGTPTAEQKANYTKVLKGHIQLAMAKYPAGTRGSQLDILARKALWDDCQNYGHGTGHGVGHFLNVHEGPQNIRMNENPTVLVPGMVTSNEPGIYIPNQYGIRIENLVLTIPFSTGDFGAFYAFETLTLCYLDNALVEVDRLTEEERTWYNNYQERVYQELSPSLNTEEATWLREKTKAI